MTMTPPEERAQIRFLLDIQRLLNEGAYTSTYKYALLLALADISVEKGDDSGGPLSVTTAEIAEKFILYYWRQAKPYAGKTGDEPQVLWQNSDRQAAILNDIIEAQNRSQSSLATLRADARRWDSLVRKVATVVRDMPLWRLQQLGGEVADFLYENVGTGSDITLRPGVVYCFRRFHALLLDLVHGAWLRFLRRVSKNQGILGQDSDLAEFLFGSDRVDLSPCREFLRDLQAGNCFYCVKPLKEQNGHVDHFIPWSLYPVDLGHNFVLAHEQCNSSKSDHIAAVPHLARWCVRNQEHGNTLQTEFERKGMVCNLGASWQISRWAYEQAETSRTKVWLEGGKLVELDTGWRSHLRVRG